jgi:hypothetical protein
MQANKTSGRPTNRCHNCGLPCNTMFCCDWCVDAYLARLKVHRGEHGRPARTRLNKDSTPGPGPKEAGG